MPGSSDRPLTLAQSNPGRGEIVVGISRSFSASHLVDEALQVPRAVSDFRGRLPDHVVVGPGPGLGQGLDLVGEAQHLVGGAHGVVPIIRALTETSWQTIEQCIARSSARHRRVSSSSPAI